MKRNPPFAFGLGVCLALLGYLTPKVAAIARAQEDATARQRNIGTNQTPQVDQPTAAKQGRRHPRYQVFAHQAALPSVAVLGSETLEVGGSVKIVVGKLSYLSASDKQALGALFGVPLGVVEKTLEEVPSQAGWGPEQLRRELCTAAIDYKYLQDRWTQDRPPIGQEKLKSDALMALHAGEVSRVWEMFLALPRPKPPGELRITGP